MSKRGPGGGYTLAREPGGITLRQVVEAVEGPLAVALEMATPGEGATTSARPNFLWTQLAASFAALLEETSLEDVCRAATLASVPRANSDAPMYFI